MALPGGYVIEKLLGGGGMANVYRAEQTALRRTVAVKIVHSHLIHDETIARRFINEARAASRLNHPHSLAVIDFGRTQEGLPYMVMEHLRGHDLARVMHDEGPLAFSRIVEILRQLLDALSEAHQLGIIHRDLKPENIVVESMRSGSDFVKVVDFGLAKLLTSTEDDVAITATGTVCGTPDFMSPEQCRGDTLDARTDLYAVGVMLFALLTERLPFMASTPTQVLLMHLTELAPDPRKVAPDRRIPQALAQVTLKALEKRPEDRFQSAAEFSMALEQAREEFDPTSNEDSLPPVTNVRCDSCGGFVPPGNKFCVECGTPMRRSTAQHRLSWKQSMRSRESVEGASTSAPPMVGREDDLLFLLDLLQEGSSQRTARVLGDVGIGKTTLLKSFAERAKMRGHLVAWIEPDRWGAGVAYHGVRSALGQLAGLAEDGADPSTWHEATGMARAGLMEVYARGFPEGLASRSGARRVAVTEALSWALHRARGAVRDARVVLVIDDMHMLDGASRNAFSALMQCDASEALFTVVSHEPRADVRLPDGAPTRLLEPLSYDAAAMLLEMLGREHDFRLERGRGYVPLLLLQSLRMAMEGGTLSFDRVGDVISTRIDRLRVHQRRVLQAVCVLGDGVSVDQVALLLAGATDVPEGAQDLVAAELLRPHTNGCLRVTHPLVRDITLGAIPAEVAKRLYGRATELSRGVTLPLEVRARYMLGAQDAFESLLLLDHLGAQSLLQDDPWTAVDVYRRGLDQARMELARGSLDDPMHAVVMFGRKLGESLIAAQRHSEAAAVLREALDFATDETSERARILLGLAQLAKTQGHVDEAWETGRKASRAAGRAGDDPLRQQIDRLLAAW